MPDTAKLVNGCLLCGKAFKWIPVIFIVTIIVWSYYAFVIQLCFFFSDGNIAQQVFYVLIYHALLVMLAWSYWKTIFTPIGTVPKQFKVSSVDLERLEQAENQEVQKQILEHLARDLPVVTRTPHGVRYCEKCVHIKPDRSHHCSVCGTCVLKMDHHCPWVNNCVGFTNYKFFLLFLGYAFIYCIFIAFTSLPYFIQFWKSELTGSGKFHVLFLFFVATMFAISLISLWSYHIYLVLHNRSTLEAFRAPIFRSGPDKDGFSLGKSNNFIEVFGDRKALWFLPITTSLRDGVTFPSRYPTTPVTMTSTPVTYYNSMDLTSSPLTTTTSPTTVPPGPADITINMGDGVSFPQRNMDEDEDALLGNRQRWMEEGQDLPHVEDSNSAYNGVHLGTLVEPV